MWLVIGSIILINLLLSIDNIIPIIFIASTLKRTSLRALALFIGLVLGAFLRIILLVFATFVFTLGNVVYVLAGILLVYIGLRGLFQKKSDNTNNSGNSRGFVQAIIAIAVIDLTLSLDNVAAIIAITQDFSLLIVGILASVVILFGMSFFINSLIHKFRGLDIAAYFAIIFLGIKFLAVPFGYQFSNTFTSGTVLLICFLTVGFVYWRRPHNVTDSKV